MAGIFKSIDQSDIRVTPFRSYKLWTDPSISYTYISNSLTDRPFTGLFEQHYNHVLGNGNTFYALSRPLETYETFYIYDLDLYDSASYALNISDDDDRLFWIDGDGFLSLAQRSASFVFGEMDTNLDKIVAYTSNSVENNVYLLNHDLTTYSSRSLSISPVVAYDACYYSPYNYKFVGMRGITGSFGGLYEYETDTDFTAVDAVGDYWGVDFGSDNNIYTLFKTASGNDLYLASYDPGAPNFIYTAPNFVRSAPSGSKNFFVYQDEPYSDGGGSIWMVFSDDTLYLSDCGDMSVTTFGMSDVVDALLDNRYSIPATSTNQAQRVHIVTKSGRIYLDAHYDYTTQTIRVGTELNVAPQVGVGLGNYIHKASITRNNESLNNGDTIITILAGNTSSLSETVLFTINTNTLEVTDPIALGSGKVTMHILAYDEDKTYATDGRASINIGTGTFLNNWYTFNL